MLVLALILGLVSAGFWIASAIIPLPERIWIQGRVGAGGPSPDVDKLVAKLRLQSRLSAAAAACQAVSVILFIVQAF